jgi:osmotically inducible protein OsmC
MTDARSTARAHWEGTLLEGSGTASTTSAALDDARMSWKARTGGEPATTPEELLGAAHSACFSMAFAGNLAKAGFTPTHLDVAAEVTFGPGDDGYEVKSIMLAVEGVVPGIEEAQFVELAEAAKSGCPISKALNEKLAVTLDARLLQPA